jgi:alpha-tubulin suppressor-like RCC1 family protein
MRSEWREGVRRTRVAVLAIVAMAVGTAAGASPGLAAGDGVTDITAGVTHACAARSDGSVWCWGENLKHEIGDGTTDPRPTPVRVRKDGGGFLGATLRLPAGAGNHTCARQAGGGARCWGQNDNGELGDGTTDPRPFPVTPTVLATGQPLGGVKALSVGADHVCALRSNGSTWCWGYNGNGRLGDGTTAQRLGAVRVVRANGFLNGVTAIGAGAFHTCAVLTDTTVRCWGANSAGQLGDGSTADRPMPVKVRTSSGRALSGVVAVVGGYRHTCALRSNGQVLCWGSNTDGQLGDGTQKERHHPVLVRQGSGLLQRIASISAGGALHTCAVTTDRRAFCWGENASGQLGDGTQQMRRKARLVQSEATGGATAFGKVLRVAVGGGGFTCALRRGGTAWCWGNNELGQTGTGDPDLVLLFPRRVLFP